MYCQGRKCFDYVKMDFPLYRELLIQIDLPISEGVSTVNLRRKSSLKTKGRRCGFSLIGVEVSQEKCLEVTPGNYPGKKFAGVHRNALSLK